MNDDLIGRGGRGGGGGGRRGGGGGGGGHRHGGGGRRFYGGGGGYGYGYPYPYFDPYFIEPEPNLLVIKPDPDVLPAETDALPVEVDEVPLAVVGAARDDLARMVAAHEVLWSRIAQRNPNHAGMRAFMLKVWNPWFQKWGLMASVPMDAAQVTALMTDLARVRGQAQAQGIPLPRPVAPAPMAYQPWRRNRPQVSRPGYRPTKAPAKPQAQAQRKPGKTTKTSGEVAIGRAEMLCGDEWISEGEGSDDLVGSEDLIELGALMAPGSRGFDVRFQVGDDSMLHASICVDGHCYEGSADLSSVLGALDQRARGYHDRLHKESAVKTAGDLLVGQMLEEHEDVIVGAWWKKFKKAAKSATYGVHKKVSKAAAKYLKGPVTMAATAVATAYGGPIAGAAAAKFTGHLMDAVAGDFKGKKAKALIESAEQEARTNPAVAKALKTAKKAVAHTVIAYTMKDTMQKAKAGNPEAKARVAELEEASSLGDFAAKQALAIMDQASEKQNEGGEAQEGEGEPSFWDRMRGQVSAQMAPKTASSGAFLPLLALAAAGGGAYAWNRHRKAQMATASANEALAIMNAALAKAKEDAVKLAAAGATDAAKKIDQIVKDAKKGDPGAVEMLVEASSATPTATEILSDKARKYYGISPSMIEGIIAALRRSGATVTGSNPYKVVANRGGVELRGTYSAGSRELLVEVTDSDFLVSYARIWDEINPMLTSGMQRAA